MVSWSIKLDSARALEYFYVFAMSAGKTKRVVEKSAHLHHLEILNIFTFCIQNFFDKVMVMSEDVGLRNARLALLLRIVGQANGIADLSKIEGF